MSVFFNKGEYIGRLLVVLLLATSVCAQEQAPADKQATAETLALYRNLFRLADKGFLFGHQDDLAYGVEWRYKEGRSDVKEVTGDYPAVYGWELGGIEGDAPANIDGVPFKKMKEFIREGYARGGVITVSWHAASPIGASRGAWDTTHGTVSSICPGGMNHELYRSWLDKVATFMRSLRGNRDEAIPILFRPFHEHTGNWFWWCRNACTPDEYSTLWRFTVYYLRQVKQLHNLLFVYNTSADFTNAAGFLEGYPGDDVVDVLSFDAYQYGDPQKEDWFVRNTKRLLEQLATVAGEKKKLFALAETGYEAVPYAEWWTKCLLPAIGNTRLSYVLVWRNHGYNEGMKRMHYYAPFKGQVSAPDFIGFYELDNTLFGREAEEARLYQ